MGLQWIVQEECLSCSILICLCGGVYNLGWVGIVHVHSHCPIFSHILLGQFRCIFNKCVVLHEATSYILLGWFKHTFLSILSEWSSLGVTLILPSQTCIGFPKDILNKMWNVFLVSSYMCTMSSPLYPSFNLSLSQGIRTLKCHIIIFLFSNVLRCCSVLD